MLPIRYVVAIPTYRRLQLLKLLLDSLHLELPANSVAILIADNDCGQDVPTLVESYSKHFTQISSIPVPERGVSQARNALVSTIVATYPCCDFILMLDDDGRVTPGWFDRITQAAVKYDATLVGGPVIGELPPGASIFAKNSIFSTRKRWPTGLVSSLNTTQNLLLSRKVIDLVGLPLFQNQYGASGGEDYDLFRRVAGAGGAIVWCDEAEVIEPAPADRLTFSSLVSRYSTTGSYMYLIDSSIDGRRITSLRAVKGFSVSIFRVMFGVLCFNKNYFARSVLSLAHFYGRLLGMVGRKTSRYVSTSGK
jgi:succinoglycan biosynthesis protein ExoM